jgi:tRNA pseudouridine55 synthase
VIGLLNIDKWPGPTSQDIVRSVKKMLGANRVGHTGTLDPPASGILLVLVEQATRTARFFHRLEKEYQARIIFGVETDTGDAAGIVKKIHSPASVTAELLTSVLPEFIGEIEQIPPMVSAVKINGIRLHKLARKGLQVARPARIRRVDQLELVEFKTSGKFPEALVRVICETGVYVRVLAVDIAARMGTVAHLSELVRTRVGSFTLQAAVPHRFWNESPTRHTLAEHLIPLEKALEFLPKILLDAEAVSKIRCGQVITLQEGVTAFSSPEDVALALDVATGKAVAVVKNVKEDKIKPVRVLPETT